MENKFNKGQKVFVSYNSLNEYVIITDLEEVNGEVIYYTDNDMCYPERCLFNNSQQWMFTEIQEVGKEEMNRRFVSFFDV
jgi:hypothetical protein